MKRSVKILIWLWVIVIINLSLYYLSEAYQGFVKSLKYGAGQNYDITDEYVFNPSSQQPCSCEAPDSSFIQHNTDSVLSDNVEDERFLIEQREQQERELQEQLREEQRKKDFLAQQKKRNIENVLEKFSNYNFSYLNHDSYFKLFGVSDEYAWEYDVYMIGWEIEIYFFSDTSYSELYDIFDYLSGISNGGFTLNPVDNFWQKSFYLNTSNNDDKVRLLLDDGRIIFWLMMKKSYYNDIKNILLTF